MKSKFSIIIPSYKRKNHLITLLESINAHIKDDTEVIVVEQGEDNGKDFKKIARELGIPFTYVFLEKPSTPKAKNIGVKKARGEYVLFFDDDVILKTSLSAFLDDFKDTSVAGVTGRSLTPGQKVEINANNTGRISLLGKFTDNFSSMLPQKIDTVIGCNAVWRKAIFLELGGFDEQFSGNAMREESDLSLRAKEHGYTILFDPRVEVFHVRAESGGARKTEGRMQWYFDFFSNEAYFFLKHRLLFLVPIILLTRIEWILRCMLGFGREVSIRSFATPFLGYIDGYKKFRRYKYENRS